LEPNQRALILDWQKQLKDKLGVDLNFSQVIQFLETNNVLNGQALQNLKERI
jgi:hypothetical protein